MTRPFDPTAIPLPGRIIGWIIRGYPEEELSRTLRPGVTNIWDDARTVGKEPGQPVLYFETAREIPRWVGWGRVAPASERWRVHGVVVVCRKRIHPPWPAVTMDPLGRHASQASTGRHGHDWETPVLGRLLGLSRYRERTPYLDSDARDVRLTALDLSFLIRFQPLLATLQD